MPDLIDLESLTSAAIRAHDEKRPALQDQIDKIHEAQVAEADAMNKPQLVAAIKAINPNSRAKASDAKPLLVEEYATLTSEVSDAATLLQQLERAAQADRVAAETVNRMVTAAEAAAGRVGETARQEGGVYQLPAHLRAVTSAVEQARWARLVIDSVNSGTDITEAVASTVLTALQEALSAPRRVVRGGPYEHIPEAVGAVDLVAELTSPFTTMGKPFMIDLTQLRW